MRDIITSFGPFYAGGTRHDVKMITKDALGCLHEAAEAYLVGVFEQAQALAVHAKRLSILQKDMIMVRYMRGERLDTETSLIQSAPAHHPNFDVGHSSMKALRKQIEARRAAAEAKKAKSGGGKGGNDDGDQV